VGGVSLDREARYDSHLEKWRLSGANFASARRVYRIKCFLSSAPAETRVQTLLLVAFSRWRVERCFEDQKQEVGLDQWEGRRWLGLKRHLILTSVSYLFLARVRAKFRGGKSRT
jgi:SRSO17 transposase